MIETEAFLSEEKKGLLSRPVTTTRRLTKTLRLINVVGALGLANPMDAFDQICVYSCSWFEGHLCIDKTAVTTL